MADKAVVTQTTLDAIGQAIVAKGGATGPMTSAQMPAAIAAIPSGGGLDGHTLTVDGSWHSWAKYGAKFKCEIGDSIVTLDAGGAGGVDFTQIGARAVIPHVSAVTLVSVSDYNDEYSHPAKLNGQLMTVGARYELPSDSNLTFSYTSACLIIGTLISLADGSKKPIEDITYDDELLVWDFDRGMLSSAKPCWIKRRETANYHFRNVLSDGTVLLTTGRSETGWGHRMYDETRNSFVYTTQSVGDEIRTLGGLKTHVSCTRVEGLCDYFNVITAHDFNLFANGVLTSCSLNNGMYDILGAKYVKEGSAARHSRDEFDGIPDFLIDGLRLCEQRGTSEELNSYVRRIMSNMKESN